MVSPWVAGFLLLDRFSHGRLARAVVFFKWDILSAPKWVGLANYVKLFSIDPLPMHALKITVIFSLASIPLNIVFGLAIAMLLNTNIRGLAVFRTIYYLPAILSGVAVAISVAVDLLQ